MGFKRLSKGKPFSSPTNKKKAPDVDATEAEKLDPTTPVKAEKEASTPQISSRQSPLEKNTNDSTKRKAIVEVEDKSLGRIDDIANNAAGGLGSSASPSSVTADGNGGIGVGTSPSSVSTAAVEPSPSKKICISTDDGSGDINDHVIPAMKNVPAATPPPPSPVAPTNAAAGTPHLPCFPFLPFLGLIKNSQGVLIPTPFPFPAVLQQQQSLVPQQASPAGPPPPAPPSSPSAILELTPVQQAVLDHANTTGQDPSKVWTSARHIALKYTAQQLLETFAAPLPDFSPSASSSTQALPLPPASTAKVTSGVSYVVRTESKQIKVTEQDILPHMVYRPPAPPAGSELSESVPEVAAVLETLLRQPTCAVSMPLKDENAMKTYLLEHAARAALVSAAEGTIMEVKGAENVADLCQDKSFVCLHYNLLQGNNTSNASLKLTPCLPSSTSTLVAEDGADTAAAEAGDLNGTKTNISSSSAAASLAASNVQLGIMIRKGVGGTYPLRSAARKLHAQGLLGALMDESLPTATTASTISANGSASPAAPEVENGVSTAGNEIPAASSLAEDPASEGPAPAHQRLSLYTLSCRLELYIDEATWEELDSHSRLVLKSTVYHLEHKLRTQFEKRNWEMLKTTMCEKLEKIVGETSDLNVPEDGKESNEDSTEDSEEDSSSLDSALAAKLIPLFSLPDKEEMQPAAATEVGHAETTGSLPIVGKDLVMDFSLAFVLSASCLSTENHSLHHMPWPLYCINTRDCFTHHLVPIETAMHTPEGRTFSKTEWFFRTGQLPADYQAVVQRCASTKTGESTGNARKCDFAAALSGENNEIVGVLANMVNEIEAKSQHAALPGDKNEEQNSTAALLPKLNTVPPILTSIYAKQTSLGALFPVGVTTYNEVFTPGQLSDIELRCDSIDTASREGRLPATCSHSTLNKAGGLKRTKFFFGARYLWTREQLAAPDAHVAKGVRVDVPPAPKWVEAVVESPLVAASVLPANHINSVALNMYHDGSEGIQVHFDDSARFQQPIFSLRLFSDSRLSFGTQLYGYTNGSFFIPMPRGCVTVMEAGSYAANGVKHCVRPVDMAGKSAGMILRRMNPTALAEAHEHFMEETIDWIQCLSLNASLRAESLLGQGITELAFGHRNRNSSHYRGAAGQGVRGAPGSKAMRQVAKTMENMLRSIEYTDWKERTLETTVASMLGKMVQRVELAENAGMNLVEKTDSAVFGVVNNLINCCEIFCAPTETPESVQRFKKKFLPPRPFFINSSMDGSSESGGGKGSRGPYKKRPRELQNSLELGYKRAKIDASGSGSVLPDAVVVALTMNRMISALEATEKKNEIVAVAQFMRRMVSCIEAQNV